MAMLNQLWCPCWLRFDVGRTVSIVVVGIASLLSVAAAHAQPKQMRIVETIWGFDGRVVPGQFNPVSILLDNLSDDPIEGVVTLRGISGMVRDAGGLLSEQIYLSPHTTRWVQFYPYVNRYSSGWRLTVMSESGVVFAETLDQGRSVFEGISGDGDSRTNPAVILDRYGFANRQPTSIKHMPDEEFPPYATATVPLSVLFLDHVPDWDSPRQQALVSWLKLGGQLHLLLDSNGEELRFPASMAELNEPFNTFTVGSGTVTRHDFQRGQLTSQVVNPLVQQIGQQDDPDAVRMDQQTELQMRNSVADPGGQDGDLFMQMRQLTQPQHAWWLIFLLSLIYVGLIFPGCWFFSQKKTLHYLATYGAIAGLSILFSLIFLFIGRRGYGESTVVHSLSIARFEDDTHCSIMQWNTLFVTDGDRYSMSAENQQALWASGMAEEQVDATIGSGNQGEFSVNIPPFSSQTLVNRRRVSLADWNLRLLEMNGTATELVSATIATGDGFPRAKETRIVLLYGRNMYEGVYNAKEKTVSRGVSLQRLVDFCSFRREIQFGGFWGMRRSDPEDQRTDEQRFYDESLHALVSRSLLDEMVAIPGAYRLPADRVRLMVYTPLPDTLTPELTANVLNSGRVLFVRDLFLQAN